MIKTGHIASLIPTLPNNPGVYQFLNDKGEIIYVGKAKDLKKRISSYFNKDLDNGKTRVLVNKTADIKYIIVSTELDALLLENNFIKKHQPRYNVMLKDDKTYPWICIKNERFPRIFSTRKIIKDGSLYFGPYASVRLMKSMLDLIKHLYKLRNCNYMLSDENIQKNKFKVCLEYHIGNCKAPCIGTQPEEDYNESISEIKNILKGNVPLVTSRLKEKMAAFSEKLEFEKAQFIKEKIDELEKFQTKSTVVNPSITDVDVFSILTDEKSGYVNFLKIMNGSIVQGHTIELKKKLEESPEELLTIAITELRQRFHSHTKEIIVPFEPDIHIPEVEFYVPQRGDKKKLLELSQRNTEHYRQEKLRQESLVDPERHTKRILQQMMKDLRMKEEPQHIECFDNSNIQGSYPVAAMTVFKDARPSRKEYRHFNIRTVTGPNDFASMEEVIYRRYKRLLEEQQPLPQLIVIDGGKGQLSSALKSLEKLDLNGKMTIIGIAKKLEEIYYPGDPLPMYIDKKSETLKVIRHIRDEAHRFGITHHRKRREKGTIRSELTEIKGISSGTAQKLLLKFKSVKNIKNASEKELEDAVGKAKGKIVFSRFHSQKSAGNQKDE